MGKLRCDICGGQIEMQPDKRGLCLNCGTSYSLATMKEMFSGVKVSITGSNEDVEQWRQLVDRYYSAGDFAEAERIVKKILEAIPDDEMANAQYNELQTLKNLEISNGVLIKYNGQDEEIFVPACVKRIAYGAFSYARYLSTLHIPSTVEDIEHWALDSHSLKDVYFSEGFEKVDPEIFGYKQLDKVTVHLPKSCSSFPVWGAVTSEKKITEADLPKVVWEYGKVTWIISNEKINSCSYRSRWDLHLLTEADIEKQKNQQKLVDAMKKEQEHKWMESGLCKYCGGTFIGLFVSKCRKCGKAKNY